MSTVTQAPAPPSKKSEQKVLWCNFCNYKTEDPAAYMTHSCVDELEKQGKTVVATGQTECR